MNDARLRFLIQQQFDQELPPQELYAVERYLETNQQGANFYAYLKHITDSAIEIELPVKYRPQDADALSEHIIESLPRRRQNIFSSMADALKHLISPRRSAERADIVKRLNGPGKRLDTSATAATEYGADVQIETGGRRSVRDQIDTGGRPSVRDQIDTGGRRNVRDQIDTGGRPSVRDQIDTGSYDDLKKIAAEMMSDHHQGKEHQSRTRSLGHTLGVTREPENSESQQLTLAELIKQSVNKKLHAHEAQEVQESPDMHETPETFDVSDSFDSFDSCDSCDSFDSFDSFETQNAHQATLEQNEEFLIVPVRPPLLVQWSPPSNLASVWADQPHTSHTSVVQSHIIAENASKFSNAVEPQIRHPWESPSERAYPQMAPPPDGDPPDRQPIIRKVERKKAPPTQQFPRPNDMGVWLEEPQADKTTPAAARKEEPAPAPVPLPIEAIIERISLLFAETVAEELEAVKASQASSTPDAPQPPSLSAHNAPPGAMSTGLPVLPSQFLATTSPTAQPQQQAAPHPLPAEPAPPQPPPVLPIDGLLERISLLFYDPADPTANMPPQVPPAVNGRQDSPGSAESLKRNTAEPWAPWLQSQQAQAQPGPLPPLPRPVPPPLPPVRTTPTDSAHFTDQGPFGAQAQRPASLTPPQIPQPPEEKQLAPDEQDISPTQAGPASEPPLLEVRRPLVKSASFDKEEAANSMGRIHGPSVSGAEDELQGRIAQIGRFLLDDRTIEQLGAAVVTGLSPNKMRVLTIEAARELETCLRPVDDQDGVAGCIIMGYDGLLVASTLPTNFDIESIATLSLASYMTTLQAARAAGHNKVLQLALRTDYGHLVLSDFGRGVLIVVSDNAKPESLPKLMWTIKHISAH